MRYRLPNPASLTPDERHTYRLAFAGKHAESFEHLGDGSLIATGVRQEGVRSLYFLAAFLGKSIRPAAGYFCSYNREADRAAAIERIKTSVVSKIAAAAERRAERARPHALKVGDVLHARWGYEQTNVDFYEVVAVRGAVVDVRELATENTATGDMTGRAIPVLGQYVGDVLRGKRPGAGNSVRVTRCSTASPWDGQPKAWSTYA
jgi:hypothetical protein